MQPSDFIQTKANRYDLDHIERNESKPELVSSEGNFMKRCKEIFCKWFLFRSHFSPYTGEKDWLRVKAERENCPKDCKGYLERMEINRINDEKYGRLKKGENTNAKNHDEQTPQTLI